MITEVRKSSKSVTTRMPWRKLLGFTDWLLDLNKWPTQDRDAQLSACPVWKELNNVRLKLEKALSTIPLYSARLDKALELIVQVEKEYDARRKLRAYRMSDFWIHYDDAGMLMLRRRAFVAKLAFEMFRSASIYKKEMSPKKDAFLNMTAYMQAKGCRVDFYDTLKQHYYRYLRMPDESPQDVIHSLYSSYLMETDGVIWTGVPETWKPIIVTHHKPGDSPKEHYSEAEAEMLEGLTKLAAKVGSDKPRKRRPKRSRKGLDGSEG